MPDVWLDSVLDHFDQGTQRAILRLYRSSPSEVLAKAGEHLGRLDMPSLVLWGMQDPYIPKRFAAEYARVLPNSELVELPDAGHWWWLDRPDTICQRSPGPNSNTRPLGAINSQLGGSSRASGEAERTSRKEPSESLQRKPPVISSISASSIDLPTRSPGSAGENSASWVASSHSAPAESRTFTCRTSG
jgi:hypothetical protein